MLLDVFIGLVFAYLLLSLLTSTVFEMISGWLSLRGVNLERALENMLSPYFRRKKLTIWQMTKIKVTTFFKKLLPESFLDEQKFMSMMAPDGARGGGMPSPDELKKAISESGLLLRPGIKIESVMPSEAARSMMARGGEMEPAQDRISLFADFMQHPLYKLLAQPEAARKPSYLSAQQFSSIMFDVLTNLAGGKSDINEIQAAVGKMKDTDLKKTLAYFVKEARDEAGLKMQLENWYNAVMSRVTGWYKRYTQYWLLGLGFAAAVFFNANTLSMYKHLSKNPESAKQAAELASAFVQNHGNVQVAKDEPTTRETPTLPTQKTGAQDSISQDSPVTQLPPETPPSAEEQIAAKQAQEINQELFMLVKGEMSSAMQPLGMGWSQGILVRDCDSTALRELEMARIAGKYPKAQQKSVNIFGYIWGRMYLGWFAFWSGLLGWLITALAVCMGAPFWFDLLKKLINVRNAGPNPDEKNFNNTNLTQDPNASNGFNDPNKVMIDRPIG